MGDAGLVLTAAASPLVFRAWTQLAAGHSGGQKTLGIAGKEGTPSWGSDVEMLHFLSACSSGAAPQSPVLGCAFQLSQDSQFPASGEQHLPLRRRLRLSH